jgi:hypothetical protein
MALEEARNTEVKPQAQRTENIQQHTSYIYDMNDGVIDIVLETDPTEAQRAGRPKERTDKQNERTTTEEKEYEIKEKYHPKAQQIRMKGMQSPTTTSQREDGTHKARTAYKSRCNCKTPHHTR